MIFKIPMNRLVITASLVGVVGASVCHGLNIRAQYRVLKKQYCLKATELIKNNQTAMDLIGEPWELLRPKMVDKEQIFGQDLIDINVPFRGDKKNGLLHIIAQTFTPINDDEAPQVKINDKDKLKDEDKGSIYTDLVEDDIKDISDGDNRQWLIKRLEIRFNDIPDKLLLVYKNDD